MGFERIFGSLLPPSRTPHKRARDVRRHEPDETAAAAQHRLEQPFWEARRDPERLDELIRHLPRALRGPARLALARQLGAERAAAAWARAVGIAPPPERAPVEPEPGEPPSPFARERAGALAGVLRRKLD